MFLLFKKETTRLWCPLSMWNILRSQHQFSRSIIILIAFEGSEDVNDINVSKCLIIYLSSACIPRFLPLSFVCSPWNIWMRPSLWQNLPFFIFIFYDCFPEYKQAPALLFVANRNPYFKANIQHKIWCFRRL